MQSLRAARWTLPVWTSYQEAGSGHSQVPDPQGDTAGALRQAGINWISQLDDSDAIAARLVEVHDAVRANAAPLPSPAAVAGASRLSRSEELAGYLARCTAS